MISFKPKALIMDFDGVFTDNKVHVDQNGVESVVCDRSDGWGIQQLKKTGIKTAVLSTEINKVVSMRCKKLKIECVQGLGEKKIDAFHRWCTQNKVFAQDVVFIGNDENDMECLNAAGCGVVPADAYPKTKEIADVILKRNGGDGAIRELCDMIASQYNG